MSRDPQNTEPADVLATSDAGPKAIRGGMIRTVGYGVSMLLSLASAPLLTRHLGVVDFGGYVSVLSLITVVGLLSDAGLTVVGIREYSTRDAAGQRLLMRNLLTLRLAITLAGVLGAVGFAALAGYDGDLVLGAVLAGVGLLFAVLQGTYAVPLSARLRFGLITGFDVLRQALTVALIIALVVADAGVVAFLAIPVPVGIVVGLGTLAAVRSVTELRPGLDRDELRYLVREAVPVAIAATIGSFFYRAVIITMSVVAVERELGYFSASFRILETLIVIPGLITAAAFPIVARAAKDDHERLRYGLQRLFEAGLILGGWMGICVLIGAEPAIAFFAGGDFDPAVPVLRIQAIVMLASFLVTVWATGLWATHGQNALAVANLIGVAAAAVLTAVLVPGSGAEGAAAAMAIAEVSLAGCYAIALMRGRSELRPSLGIVPKVAVAIGGALAVWLVPLPDVALVVLASLAYFAILALVRGIPWEVWDAFRNRAQRESPAPAAAARPEPPA